MIIDLRKLHLVAELSNEAESYAKNRDYGKAENIADDIAVLGYPGIASDIYIRTGKIERAREILIPVAEQLSRQGHHIRAAAHYFKLDMVEEYLLEIERHRTKYEICHKELMN